MLQKNLCLAIQSLIELTRDKLSKAAAPAKLNCKQNPITIRS